METQRDFDSLTINESGHENPENEHSLDLYSRLSCKVMENPQQGAKEPDVPAISEEMRQMLEAWEKAELKRQQLKRAADVTIVTAPVSGSARNEWSGPAASTNACFPPPKRFYRRRLYWTAITFELLHHSTQLGLARLRSERSNNQT